MRPRRGTYVAVNLKVRSERYRLGPVSVVPGAAVVGTRLRSSRPGRLAFMVLDAVATLDLGEFRRR
jgi:hypothetical protein